MEGGRKLIQAQTPKWSALASRVSNQGDTFACRWPIRAKAWTKLTLARAVEPFFSTKGIGKGTGLGLSMVHGLASQLGGAMTIQSRLGVGTNVELWLPAAAAPVELLDEEGDVVHGAPVIGTALLVDDEELVRMSTADMLSDLGYKVVEAASAEEALRLLNGGLRADLIVTDHLMPGMNGTDLARSVRLQRPNIQVLLISGYSETEGIAPDLPRLSKPFRNADLAASLAALRQGNRSFAE
jgi:CheY-like chemotaxis protein